MSSRQNLKAAGHTFKKQYLFLCQPLSQLVKTYDKLLRSSLNFKTWLIWPRNESKDEIVWIRSGPDLKQIGPKNKSDEIQKSLIIAQQTIEYMWSQKLAEKFSWRPLGKKHAHFDWDQLWNEISISESLNLNLSILFLTKMLI